MYYDLLAKIVNAERAKKGTLTTRFSKLDFAVAKILAKAGYLADFQKKSIGRKSFIEIKFNKHNAKTPLISGFKVMSKPSRRLYVDYRNIRLVKQGYGLGVISTSRGVMSSKEARKNKVGGEYLFQIW